MQKAPAVQIQGLFVLSYYRIAKVNTICQGGCIKVHVKNKAQIN